MDINGWLTVITVFTAIFALLPKEDLFFRFLRTSQFEKILFSVINLVLVPYLIFFERIAQRWRCFENFTWSWGFDPANIAFLLFYISLLWLLFRLFSKPKIRTDAKIIEFFKDLLNEKPFNEFFKLFTKYTSVKRISDSWETYKEVFFQPRFLQNILELRPSYLLQFWKKFNTENDFQSIFRLFLENPNSAYYSEIKEHWNSYSLLADKPFLNTVIKDNLSQSIDNGIFMNLTDHVSRHLQSENGANCIYNRPHFDLKISGEEGFDLPLYYHIQFIGILYSTAIENKTDIGKLSKRYLNMQSIYSSMVGQMLNNFVVAEDKKDKVYQTNYHWLIGEIFKIQGHWLSEFSDKWKGEDGKGDKESSYISFIPFSMSLCLDHLYKGLEDGKVELQFITEKIHYYILMHYYSTNNVRLLSSIEEKFIKRIPRGHLDEVLRYSINGKYAISFDDFKNDNFEQLNGFDNNRLERLLGVYNKIISHNGV
jgi:hypothetical protein